MDQAEELRKMMTDQGFGGLGGSIVDKLRSLAKTVQVVGMPMSSDQCIDGYWWSESTKHPGNWSLLRKLTTRQSYGQPWKNLETGKRMTWQEITQRFSRLVKVEEPK